jgi:hypothetical protein
MELDIDQDFAESEYVRFGERLRENVRALESLLERPGFGAGPMSLGAELELALVGEDCRPRHVNVEVLRETIDPRMTVELDRFNLESNLRPIEMSGRPFSHLDREMNGALVELSRAAELHDARVAMVGIVPTLRAEDLQSNAMTDTPRYRALSRALQEGRHEPFALRIDGEDPLEIECDDVTFEGAATSLQIHLRVPPRDFARFFNAAQLATVPVLALAGNSPTFLGHRLWHETRVALFKQAVDDRTTQLERLRRRPRVSFGSGWNREGAAEIFSEAVRDFPPLLPAVGDEDPIACVTAGGVPRLAELRLHQGTVWSWNRPVYDPADGGHLRIEFRALPAGPSIPDMVANAAFLVGLTIGLADEVAVWKDDCFQETHTGFYRAAQAGPDAQITWPSGNSAPAGTSSARDLIPHLLEVAQRGLASVGVDATEVDEQLEVVSLRCERKTTGALWQRHALERAEKGRSREAALERMLAEYLDHSRAGLPVHAWP